MTAGLKSLNIGVVGATGAVGRELLAILEERDVDPGSIRCIASPRSAGSELPYRDDRLPVRTIGPESFDGLDAVLFASGAESARRWAAAALEAGCLVIDNSSAFRSDPAVPLVVPEINGDLLSGTPSPGIVANPNCSAVIATMAVAPIHRATGITRLGVTTYQSVSGAGTAAMRELERQSRQHAAGEPLTCEVFPSPALFNVFSHESAIDDDGHNEEERKIRSESRRILDAPELMVAATCVRVGVPRAHAMSIELELAGPLEVERARALLEAAPGIRVVDDRGANRFPEPRRAAGADAIEVGRLRAHPDRTDGRGLLLLAAGDQLRKGAALNAIQILERLVRG